MKLRTKILIAAVLTVALGLALGLYFGLQSSSHYTENDCMTAVIQLVSTDPSYQGVLPQCATLTEQQKLDVLQKVEAYELAKSA